MSLVADAQPFNNSAGNFNRDEIEFDENFIRANRISVLHIEYSKKIPGSPIQDLEDSDRIVFDKQGRKIEHLQIRSNRINTDSSWTEWIYDGEQLIAKGGQDRLGKFREEFDCLGENECTVKMLRNGVYITEEKIITTKPQDTLEVTKYFNSDQIHFKTLHTYYRSDGRLHEQTEEYHFSGKRSKSRYEYGDKGWVTICYRSHGDQQVQTSYDYSSLAELMMVKYYKNQQVVETLELLYDRGLPEAWILKDIETNRLKIAKFKFERSIQ